VKGLFKTCYTLPLDVFVRRRAGLLTRRDGVTSLIRFVRRTRAEVAKQPDPKLETLVERFVVRIRVELLAIDRDDQALFKECRLRPGWLRTGKENPK